MTGPPPSGKFKKRDSSLRKKKKKRQKINDALIIERRGKQWKARWGRDFAAVFPGKTRFPGILFWLLDFFYFFISYPLFFNFFFPFFSRLTPSLPFSSFSCLDIFICWVNLLLSARKIHDEVERKYS